MNPYEVSHISSDSIQSFLNIAESISFSSLEITTDVLKDRLHQLQQVHSKSWNLLRHNEHAEFIMARLESMDVLCGRLLPLMDAAKHVSSRRLAKLRTSSFRIQSPRNLFHRSRSRSWTTCVSFARDELGEIIEAVNEELRTWLDYQNGIFELISSQAFGVFPRLQTLALEGYYPVPGLLKRVLDCLSSNSSRAVIVSGPSGVGKSSLARYVASNSPEFLLDGTAEVHFGSSCMLSRGKEVYEQSLLEQLKLLLHDLNCQQKAENLIQAWTMLEHALEGSAYLILLDDVREKGIVDRFMQFRNHNCKYFVTCREDPVYSSSSVSSIPLGLKEVAEVSEDILAFHCGMVDRDALPVVAAKLLKCCSHHPLAVSILGEALRGTRRSEEWIAVMLQLQACSPPSPSRRLSSVPKEQMASVFGSIELSVVGMALETQSFFHALASLAWVHPVPVDCLKALWSVAGDHSALLLQTRELVRRSLLRRSSDFTFYELHEIMVLYLQRRIVQAVEVLLKFSEPGSKALVAPWLIHYGNAEAKEAAEGTLKGILLLENEQLHAKALLCIVDVLSCCSDSNKQKTCKEFNFLVGPAIVNLLFRATSLSTCGAIVKYMAACFTNVDYEEYGRGLVASGISGKLKHLLSSDHLGGSVSILVKKDAADVMGKLAGTRDSYVVEKLVKANLIHELVLLLDPKSGWIHEGIITAIGKMAENRELTTKALLQTDLIEKLFTLLHSRKHALKLRALSTFALLIPAGGTEFMSHIFEHGLVEELVLLLNCPSEDVRANASVLCQQLCSIGRESTVCMDRLLKTQLVETLTGLLNNELEKSRTCAVISLKSLVRARGRPVAERLLRAAGLESIQKGMESPGLHDTGYKAYRHLMISLCENT